MIPSLTTPSQGSRAHRATDSAGNGVARSPPPFESLSQGDEDIPSPKPFPTETVSRGFRRSLPWLVLASCVLAACSPTMPTGDHSPAPTGQSVSDPLGAVPAPRPLPANVSIAPNLSDTNASPDALTTLALMMAASSDGTDQRLLGDALVDAAFLARLDTATDYQQSYHQLRLSQVLQRLSANPRPEARAVLVRLTTNPTFGGHVLRLQLLIRALAHVRPAEPSFVDFWTRASVPNHPLAYDVVDALAFNQSEPALALLVSLLTDVGHTEDMRRAWLRQLILPRRNDAPLLLACEQVLARNPSPAIQVALAESLFDYRPEWYVGDLPPTPPVPGSMTPPARRIRARLAEACLKIKGLDAPARAAIAKEGKKP